MPRNSAPLVDSLEKLFTTPSVMKGEDGNVYAALYALVEDVAQPKDVWDQMMVADITNHFWEQQRYRRSTGAIVNSKRRSALLTILCEGIGLNSGDAGKIADIYFDVARENPFDPLRVDKLLQQDRVPVPETRPGVLAFLKEHGYDETDIDRVAMESIG